MLSPCSSKMFGIYLKMCRDLFANLKKSKKVLVAKAYIAVLEIPYVPISI